MEIGSKTEQPLCPPKWPVNKSGLDTLPPWSWFQPQTCLISFVNEPHRQHRHTQSSFCIYLDTTWAAALVSCRAVVYVTISLASWLLLSRILLLFTSADRLFRVPPQPPHACTPPLKVITQNACFPWSSTEQAVLCFSPSRTFLQQFLEEEVIYPELKHLVIVLPG